MQQLIEKIYKAADKEDSNKVIDLMLDAKKEVETHTGISINLEKKIDDIEREIKIKEQKFLKRNLVP